MGANTKEKGPEYECGECERKFQTPTALKIHYTVKHQDTNRPIQQSDYKTLQGNEIDDSPSKEEKKTALVPPTSRVSKRIQEMRSIHTEPLDEDSDSISADKTVFACPKCDKAFRIYFTACKHIQKRHCVDGDGNPVPPEVLELIKPIRREICSVCSKEKLSDECICCGDEPSADRHRVRGSYTCLGCKRNFLSVGTFDNHIAASHCEDIDTMIFDTFDEFLRWKTDLEKQVLVKYECLTSIATQSQYYHCNYISPKNTAEVTHLCPSVLIAKHFSKTIQINYYKSHCEHTCSYKMPKQFESYVLAGTAKHLLDKSGNDELVVKFRSLMRGILNAASIVNVAKLKKLYSLAEEMDACLKNQDDFKSGEDVQAVIRAVEEAPTEIVKGPVVESTEKDITSKSMNDDQITKVLEQPRMSARLKRKSESSDTVSKKDKTKATETKSGLKESNAITKDANFESPKSKSKVTLSDSPSFADSYKKFIDSNLKVKSSPGTRKSAKKTVVKTRIGQFSPRQPEQDATDTENVDTAKKKRKSYVTSPKASVVVSEVVTHIVQSPKRAAESDDNIVQKRKKISVTYPNTSKKSKDSIRSPGTSIANINLEDVTYEVLEQENDCNILVLKI